MTYSNIRHLINHVFLAEQDGLWGIIDDTNRILVDFKYQRIGYFSRVCCQAIPQRSSAHPNPKWGIVNFYQNKVVLDFLYDDFYYFGSSRYLAVAGDDKYFIDYQAQMIAFLPYDRVFKFRYDQDFTFVMHHQKMGMIDKDGKELIKPTHDWLWAFYDDRAKFKSSGRYGFLDRDGQAVIEPIYERAYEFHQGLAGVCQNGLWGFIDVWGNIVIPCIYDKVESFCHHRAIGFYQGKRVVIKMPHPASAPTALHQNQ